MTPRCIPYTDSNGCKDVIVLERTTLFNDRETKFDIATLCLRLSKVFDKGTGKNSIELFSNLLQRIGLSVEELDDFAKDQGLRHVFALSLFDLANGHSSNSSFFKKVLNDYRYSPYSNKFSERFIEMVVEYSLAVKDNEFVDLFLSERGIGVGSKSALVILNQEFAEPLLVQIKNAFFGIDGDEQNDLKTLNVFHKKHHGDRDQIDQHM